MQLQMKSLVKKNSIKKVKKDNQMITKGIEVGHIFYFSDKYSKPLNCFVDTKDGKKTSIKMGSYGIGVSRLVAAIIEAKFLNNKMKWPKSISPFDVVIIPNFNKNNTENLKKAEKVYEELKKQNIDALLDDTDESMSSKFTKHELIGIPNQIIIGSKSTSDKFEYKNDKDVSSIISLEEIKNLNLYNKLFNRVERIVSFRNLRPKKKRVSSK